MTVDLTRHYPECNDMCVECVLWRKIDALVTSYEAKVEDFAAETRRNSALTAERDALLERVERLEGALERAHLARIEAQNPGIDMARVVRERRRNAALLAADEVRIRADQETERG